MSRSNKVIFAVLSLAGCFSVTGCFLGNDGLASVSIRIELIENYMDEPSSELTWILTTILEAERYDCEFLAELHLRRSNEYRWHTCMGSGNNLMVTYLVDRDEVELRVRNQPSDIGARVDSLMASFEAANLRYVRIR